jgi:hypothetical protein
MILEIWIRMQSSPALRFWTKKAYLCTKNQDLGLGNACTERKTL